MSIALIVGPAAAAIGIVAVFFVLRRKSVEKRSMYSARRSQIEHKVRAARQRTLAPHGRPERPVEAPPPPAPTSIYAPGQATPTVTYQPAAYQPPPPATPEAPAAPASPSPWEVGPVAPPTPPPFAAPPPPQPEYKPEPFQPEPFTPAAQPAYEPPPSEPAWTPGPAPSEPATPLEPASPLTAAPASSTSPAGAGWSIVTDNSKTPAASEPETKKKGGKGAPAAAWTLASGDAPGTESAEEIVKKPSAAIAIAQYAVLVVGLVMVLIGVIVMVANSHVS